MLWIKLSESLPKDSKPIIVWIDKDIWTGWTPAEPLFEDNGDIAGWVCEHDPKYITHWAEVSPPEVKVN